MSVEPSRGGTTFDGQGVGVDVHRPGRRDDRLGGRPVAPDKHVSAGVPGGVEPPDATDTVGADITGGISVVPEPPSDAPTISVCHGWTETVATERSPWGYWTV